MIHTSVTFGDSDTIRQNTEKIHHLKGELMYSPEETINLRLASPRQVWWWAGYCPGSKGVSNRKGVGEVTSECRLAEVLLILSFNALCCHVSRVKHWWQVSSVCSSIGKLPIKAWCILVEEVISTRASQLLCSCGSPAAVASWLNWGHRCCWEGQKPGSFTTAKVSGKKKTTGGLLVSSLQWQWSLSSF